MNETRTLLAYAQSSLLGFTALAIAQLNPDHRFHKYWPLLAVHLRLKQIWSGGHHRLVMDVPYDYHITEMVGICFATWSIAKKPTTRLLLVFENYRRFEEAKEQFDCLIDYGWLQRIFKKLTIIRKGDHEWVTPQHGSIYFTYIGGELPKDSVDHISCIQAIRNIEFDLYDQNCDEAVWCIEHVFPCLQAKQSNSIVVLNQRQSANDLNMRLLIGEPSAWEQFHIPPIPPKGFKMQISEKNGGQWIVYEESEILEPDPISKKEGRELDHAIIAVFWPGDELYAELYGINS